MLWKKFLHSSIIKVVLSGGNKREQKKPPTKSYRLGWVCMTYHRQHLQKGRIVYTKKLSTVLLQLTLAKIKNLGSNILKFFGNKPKKWYSVNLSCRWFHVRVIAWIIDFLPNLTKLLPGTNKRLFIADLVLYECAAQANL